MEIYLLTQAQHKAKQKEAADFDQLAHQFDWQLTRRQRDEYLNALRLGYTLVLTDPSRTILWVSQSFLSLTGYTTTEAIGQTPRFLQGTHSNGTTLNHVRKQLNQEIATKADLINYRKNGEPYVCRIDIDPLRNSQGELTHFLAVESEVV